MIMTSIPAINQLSTEQKLELIGELWDEVMAHADEIPLHAWQKAELDRSYEEYVRSPETAKPWPVVREQIRRSL